MKVNLLEKNQWANLGFYKPERIALDTDGSIILKVVDHSLHRPNDEQKLVRLNDDGSIDDILETENGGGDRKIYIDGQEDLSIVTKDGEAKHYRKPNKLLFSLKATDIVPITEHHPRARIDIKDMISLGNGYFRGIIEYVNSRTGILVYAQGDEKREIRLPDAEDWNARLVFEMNDGELTYAHMLKHKEEGHPTDLRVTREGLNLLITNTYYCSFNDDVYMLDQETGEVKVWADSEGNPFYLSNSLSDVVVDPISGMIAVANYSQIGQDSFKEGITILDPEFREFAHITDKATYLADMKKIDDKFVVAFIYKNKEMPSKPVVAKYECELTDSEIVLSK